MWGRRGEKGTPDGVEVFEREEKILYITWFSNRQKQDFFFLFNCACQSRHIGGERVKLIFIHMTSPVLTLTGSCFLPIEKIRIINTVEPWLREENILRDE